MVAHNYKSINCKAYSERFKMLPIIDIFFVGSSLLK